MREPFARDLSDTSRQWGRPGRGGMEACPIQILAGRPLTHARRRLFNRSGPAMIAEVVYQVYGVATAHQIRELAAEIARRSVLAFGSNRVLHSAESFEQDIVRQMERLGSWMFLGAPALVFGVCLIWPRSEGDVVAGEINCECGSWTSVDLPEVLFLPGWLYGRGATDIRDAWTVDWVTNGPLKTVCPSCRDKWPYLSGLPRP